MLSEVLLVEKPKIGDSRGLFSKTFGERVKSQSGIELSFAEVFYSVSSKNVLRGMHYQKRPDDHYKLISVIKGSVLDAVVDIDPLSPSYGDSRAYDIDENSNFSILIPPGLAHGFLAKCDDTIMLYHTTSVHAPASDTGVRWDSFGLNWPISSPIISERDQNLPAFGESQW